MCRDVAEISHAHKLVMPAGNFHRVVRTEDIQVLSILTYAHRDQVTGTWAEIVGEMQVGEVAA